MKKIVLAAGAFLLPVITFAQSTSVTGAGAVTNADTLFRKINSILNAIIPILISIAVVYLVYAIVMYVIAGDEDQKKAGKSMIVYGVIGLFVILSIWGLVNILVNTFGLQNRVDPSKIPTVLPINQNIGGN